MNDASCTGHRTNLDEEDALPRTEELTLASIEAFSYKELWEDHGIVADVMVLFPKPSFVNNLILARSSPSLKVSLEPRSMNYYHRTSSTN